VRRNFLTSVTAKLPNRHAGLFRLFRFRGPLPTNETGAPHRVAATSCRLTLGYESLFRNAQQVSRAMACRCRHVRMQPAREERLQLDGASLCVQVGNASRSFPSHYAHLSMRRIFPVLGQFLLLGWSTAPSPVLTHQEPCAKNRHFTESQT
jgi:hypothetical protein